ncbi:hypothetical protein V6N11_065269 [Hibiscus sabdariffa]|uniref:Uncharacterized protein n=1 Tax=Hibiscus sabdariffa TaxID=183260 RepID=A0ABR2QGH1_9ROSI
MAHRRANAITTLKHSDGLWCSDISMEVDFYKALFTSSNLHGAEFSTRGFFYPVSTMARDGQLGSSFRECVQVYSPGVPIRDCSRDWQWHLFDYILSHELFLWVTAIKGPHSLAAGCSFGWQGSSDLSFTVKLAYCSRHLVLLVSQALDTKSLLGQPAASLLQAWDVRFHRIFLELDSLEAL